MNLRTIRPFTALGLAALLAAAAGCGKSNPASPSAAAQMDADDAAQQVALSLSLSAGGAPSPGAVPGASARRAADAYAVAAAETTFSAGNVTWTLTRTWFDAGGTEQASFDPVTTVRMLATSRGVGAVETATDTANFGGAGTLDVHGVSTLQDTLVTDAARNDTLLAVFTPPFRGGRVHVYSESAATWSAVTQLKPVQSNPWPLSGTATWTLHVSRLRSGNRGDISRTYDSTVLVTFNGTRYPDVTVSGGFRYRFDLLTGGVLRR